MSRLIEGLEPRVLFTTFVVNTLTDDADGIGGIGDGLLSLREAITAANTNTAFGDAKAGSENGDVIVFSPTLRQQTVSLAASLDITDDLQINGGLLGITLDGAAFAGSIIIVNSNQRTTLTGLRLINCTSADRTLNLGGGGSATLNLMTFENNLGGGGVFNTDHRLTIYNSSFIGNSTAIVGGAVQGITNSATTIYNSTFTGNTAQSGGALDNQNTVMNVYNCRFTNNSASTTQGGAIRSVGQTRVWGSRFTNNSAVTGGAISSRDSRLDVRNSIFDGNASSVGVGGAIQTQDTANVTILGSRFTRNTAPNGGAIAMSGSNGSGRLSVRASFFQDNSAGVTPVGFVGFGGAIYLNSSLDSVVEIDGCVLRGNWALRNGGAISAGNANITVAVRNSLIQNNEAEQLGGGVYYEGGLGLTIQGSALIDNDATGVNGSGGGLFNIGNATLRNTLVLRNTAVTGGGIFSDTLAVTTLVNSVVRNNTPDNTAGPGTVA